MAYELVIAQSDGTERARLSLLDTDGVGRAGAPSLNSLRISRAVVRDPGEPDTAGATVYRDSWLELAGAIQGRTDTFTVEDDGTPIFGGRLRDAEVSGPVVNVLLDGPKGDAVNARPSEPSTRYQPQPDADIILNQLLPRMPTISTGTIETVDSTASLSEDRAFPGQSLTNLSVASGAEVIYRPDFSLDYVAQLGRDRNRILSPLRQTVISDPRVAEKVSEDVTHIRVVGSQEVSPVIEAEAVRDSFTGREVYSQVVDSDITDQPRAENLADQLIAEYDGGTEYVEAEFELPAEVEPQIGDSFVTQLPAQGIDTRLRVLEVERTIDSNGERFSVLLSNRKLSQAR